MTPELKHTILEKLNEINLHLESVWTERVDHAPSAEHITDALTTVKELTKLIEKQATMTQWMKTE